ncbi:ArsR family transcriptional regulator [Paenibacillus sp. GCM10023248]|uniref:ArsR family transcriptional regulator n=1 Tax=unclassified Paenibacillus TaxID=185978 RepID=UPI00361A0155
MKNQMANLSLKVFVLYVHREYSTHEIAKILGVSQRTVSGHLKKIELTSRSLKILIQKQKKLNLLNAQSKQQELKLGRI